MRSIRETNGFELFKFINRLWRNDRKFNDKFLTNRKYTDATKNLEKTCSIVNYSNLPPFPLDKKKAHEVE